MGLVLFTLFISLALAALPSDPVDKDDVVQMTPGADTAPAPVELKYQSSNQQIPIATWKKKIKSGRKWVVTKTNWEPNPLVSVQCPKSAAESGVYIRTLNFKDNKTYSCINNTKMAEPLAQFINQNLKNCLHVGMRAAGIPGIVKTVQIDSLGTINARRVKHPGKDGCAGQGLTESSGLKCSISYHATGRAIDVTTFNVTTEDGKQTVLPASCVTPDGAQTRREGFDKKCKPQGPMGQFYAKFKSCWNDKVQAARQQCAGKTTDVSCKDLQTSCSDSGGAVGCDEGNSLHYNHLHLSLPLCPHPNTIAIE